MRMEELASSRCLRAASALGIAFHRIGFRIKHLSLQVALLDVIAIDQMDRPGSGARQQRRLHGSQRAAAHNHRCGGTQPRLPFRAERGEARLSTVAVCVQRTLN